MPDNDLSINRRHLLLGGLALAGTTLLGCQRQNAQTTGHRYRVIEGDTWGAIASANGVSIAELLEANHPWQGKLEPGTMVWVPAATNGPQSSPALTTDESITQASALVAAPSSSGPKTPSIIRRHDWHAPKPGSNADPMNGIKHITIHHSGEYPGMSGYSDSAVVHSICNAHRNRGWADIGYHFLVGRDGRVYEGRTLDLQGAHSGGDNNKHNIGISVIGDFQRTLPNKSQLETLDLMIGHLQQIHRIPKINLHGHRDWKATLCPGEKLYDWIINRAV